MISLDFQIYIGGDLNSERFHPLPPNLVKSGPSNPESASDACCEKLYTESCLILSCVRLDSIEYEIMVVEEFASRDRALVVEFGVSNFVPE